MVYGLLRALLKLASCVQDVNSSLQADQFSKLFLEAIFYLGAKKTVMLDVLITSIFEII